MMITPSSSGMAMRRSACLAAHSWSRGGIAYYAPALRKASSGMRTVVHASGNGTGQYDYDLFTIGAGSGGVRASRFASSYGAKVAVCELPFDYISNDEAGGVGGTCVLRGCVPKKLMVYASEYANDFKDAVGFGWDRAEPGHNWTKFMEAKRKELQRLNNAYKNTLNNAKVMLIEGHGRVVGPHEVEVAGKRYTAKNILIAVGGRATKPPIPGAEYCITSDEALELPSLPKKATIIGGGYIAMEFGGIFNRFGSEVQVVWRQALPLGGFDEEVRKFVYEQYKLTGMKMCPESSPTEIRKQPDGKLTAIFERKDGSKHEITDNDVVLMATGRKPNTKTLGLESVGVKLGQKGELLVDEYSRTNVPSIWAIGDCTNRVQLTPVALMEGMALAKTIALDQPTKPDYAAVPSAVFSHPQIATVGLSEEAAKKEHPNLDIYTTSFRGMRNTISGSELKHFIKIIVDADTDKVVGIHMVGEESGEILQGFAVAVKAGVTKKVLDSTIGIHPTAAEELVTMRSVTRKVRQSAPVPAAA